MKNLEEIADAIESEMDEKDTVREVALKSSRAVIRLAGNAIRAIHRDEKVDKTIEEAREEAFKLISILQDHSDLFHAGFVENAFKELSEACMVFAISKNKLFPSPKELGVTNSAYLLGLGDVVGELRRFALDSLRNGDIDKASNYLDMMEDIYLVLMRFDYPTALVAVRRKQDLARSLIEKTRGEIAVAIRGHKLEKKISGLEKLLRTLKK